VQKRGDNERNTAPGRVFFILLLERMVGLEWTVIVSAAAAISGIVLGWLGHARTIKNEAARDAAADADLRTSVNYIRQAVDEMRVEIRLLRQDYAELVERVAKVEESAKSAHRRIDRIEGRNDG